LTGTPARGACCGHRGLHSVANTWGWPVNGDLHFELFSHLTGGLVGRELIRRLNLFVNVMIPAGHRRRKPSAAEMVQYRLALATRQHRHASAVLPQAVTASRSFLAGVEDGLGALTHLPALIAWADGDIAFRDSERRQWEQRLPHHTTVTLEGVGHYLQSDAPDELAEAIRRWWRGAECCPRKRRDEA
jgi:haloalkane dehalogenase